MSLRVLLAVSLSLAIVGVAITGIDQAGERRTEHFLRGEVGAVANAGASLLDRDEVVPRGSPGARRVVAVTLPEKSLTTASLDYLAFGGSPGNATLVRGGAAGIVTYRLEDGREQRIWMPIPLVPSGDRPVVLRDAGVHQVILRLGYRGDQRVVEIRDQRSQKGQLNSP